MYRKRLQKSGQKSMNWRPKRRKEKNQVSKIRDERGILGQTIMTFRRSYRNTLKTYTPANWIMQKK
jgi:hypothetical protein